MSYRSDLTILLNDNAYNKFKDLVDKHHFYSGNKITTTFIIKNTDIIMHKIEYVAIKWYDTDPFVQEFYQTMKNDSNKNFYCELCRSGEDYEDMEYECYHSEDCEILPGFLSFNINVDVDDDLEEYCLLNDARPGDKYTTSIKRTLVFKGWETHLGGYAFEEEGNDVLTILFDEHCRNMYNKDEYIINKL